MTNLNGPATAPRIAGRLAPTLPGECYTDPAVLTREMEAIFENQWFFVGRTADLPARGDVLRVDVGRENVIVVRDRGGELHAFLNVCRHRGAVLCHSDRANVGNAIRCPYHAWAYRLDGSLIVAPNWEELAGDLDRDFYGLVPVRLDTWQGMIWVNVSGDAGPLEEHLAPQLEFRLGGRVDRLDRYRIADLAVGDRREYTVGANWKIIQENFQECYHCESIHPELVEQIPSFVDFEQLLSHEGYNRDGYPFAMAKEAFSLSGTATLPTLPGITGEEERRYFGMVLRPNAFLSLLPDHVIMHRFIPVSVDETRVVCEWLFDPEAAASPDFDCSDTVGLFHRVNLQDFQASEWCQPNMGSRAYRQGGALVPGEKEIIGDYYHAWYRQSMGM
ncbi:MAG: aromatic ring-hydroxylating dioxygenase subunit alpha [Microbacteriaceae bacterium]